MFESYSQRARRVIFWSLHYARGAGSPCIEPEHILQALLLEDPKLFHIILPERPTVVEDLKTALGTPKDRFITQGKDIPLSRLGRDVVAMAAEQQKRLGHAQVASQDLLLAILLSPSNSSNWFLRKHQSRAQLLLSEHGVTAELVEEKTKEGIITPTTWVFDDEVLALNAQLGALADLLIAKGIFNRAEFIAALDNREGPFPPETFLHPLIDALARKDLLVSREQEELKRTKAGDQDKGKQEIDPSQQQQGG